MKFYLGAPRIKTYHILRKKGLRWCLQMKKLNRIHFSQADKGGATLILDYNTVTEEIEKELGNKEKYEILNEKAYAHCNKVTAQIKRLIIDLHKRDIMNDQDKTMITGLSNKNKMKHAPE